MEGEGETSEEEEDPASAPKTPSGLPVLSTSLPSSADVPLQQSTKWQPLMYLVYNETSHVYLIERAVV